ncbi:MAG: hypothetical protein PHD95_02090 [Candidatus ainarchaeum sp.]|nr:hypothetical protein [Candidatus ainarchaeum sp.]
MAGRIRSVGKRAWATIRGSMARKPVFRGRKIGVDAQEAVFHLKDARLTRTIGTVFAALSGVGIQHHAIAKGAQAVANAMIFQMVAVNGIRSATKFVGKELSKEALQNQDLKTFLQSYKFVIIDRKGRIRGTDQKQVLQGVGRIRLETSRILNNWY